MNRIRSAVVILGALVVTSLLLDFEFGRYMLAIAAAVAYIMWEQSDDGTEVDTGEG